MGATHATLKPALRGQKGHNKCVPHIPYQPLNASDLGPTRDGGLVLELDTLPSILARDRCVPAGTYWWMDAQFLPYNDAQLMVTATAFTPRSRLSWVRVDSVLQGRLILFDLRFQPPRDIFFPTTASSVYPKVQPHPLGGAVAYAGKGATHVISLQQQQFLYTKDRDLNNRTQHFCAISPNGNYFAILSKAMGFYYLEIFMFDFTLLMMLPKPVECHKMCKGFVGNRFHNDHAECKWSPDGSHIALSSSEGVLFVMTKSGTKNVCSICPDALEVSLSTAGSYDFYPQSRFSVLAVGTNDEMLSVVKIAEEENDCVVLAQTETSERIDCVQYNFDGSAVAASFRSFTVKLYDPSELTELHSISMANLCPEHVSKFASSPYPTTMRLSFSFDGRYLATSSCDSVVRVWSIPKLLSLQEWCRRTLLSSIPILKVRELNLPCKIKAFLLSEYF